MILACIALSAWACNGADSSGDDSVDASPTPRPAATVEGSNVFFSAKGYNARIPDGWSFDDNAVNAPGLSVDTFLAPAEEGQIVQPNVGVSCEQPDSAETPDVDTYTAARKETAVRLGAKNLAEDSLDVDGQPARMLTYDMEREGASFQRSELLLISQRCFFSIAFTITPEKAGELTPLFEQFLEDFEVVN